MRMLNGRAYLTWLLPLNIVTIGAKRKDFWTKSCLCYLDFAFALVFRDYRSCHDLVCNEKWLRFKRYEDTCY